MDNVILLCLVILLIIMIAMIFSRSQAVQRIGLTGLVLVLSIGGASLYGFLKSSEFAEEQYEQMYALSLGTVYAYMQELERDRKSVV